VRGARDRRIPPSWTLTPPLGANDGLGRGLADILSEKREVSVGLAGLGRMLMIAGALLFVLGLGLSLLGRAGLGRLPGDIVVERGSFSFYFPIVTSILLSLILSGLVWLLRR
jgi:hypothetical protein